MRVPLLMTFTAIIGLSANGSAIAQDGSRGMQTERVRDSDRATGDTLRSSDLSRFGEGRVGTRIRDRMEGRGSKNRATLPEHPIDPHHPAPDPHHPPVDDHHESTDSVTSTVVNQVEDHPTADPHHTAPDPHHPPADPHHVTPDPHQPPADPHDPHTDPHHPG